MRALLLSMLLYSCHLFEPVEPEAEPVTYTVSRGDTLWKISKTYDVPVADIQAANGLSGDTIEIGQVLIIPTDTPAPAATARSGARSGSGSGSGRVASPRVSAPRASSGLVMPAEKACLSGPVDVEGGGDEPSMVSSVGLSRGQIKGVMDGFLSGLSVCVEGDWPVGEARLEVTVACTGRVSSVEISDRGGLPAGLLSCVTERLRYASFPAHDLPDGERFAYPLRFSGP